VVTANDTLVVRYASCKRAAVSVVFATFQLSQVSFSATSAHSENLKTTGKDYRHMKIAIIGSGRIGGLVGRLWAEAGHQVRFSSRHPASSWSGC
jgi:lactate dehydrogenase-like 2-hydroxyacid dehydrogenase